MRRAMTIIVYTIIAVIAVGMGTRILIRLDTQHKESVALIYENYELEQQNRQESMDVSAAVGDVTVKGSFQEEVSISEDVLAMAVPSTDETETEENMGMTQALAEIELNEDMKVVWFGTAIPAFGNEAAQAYPQGVGEILGVQVYNESIGNSSVRAGSADHITADDPMGYSGVNWDVLLKSLSLSTVEKDEIMDNWQDWRTKLQGTPPWQLSDKEKAFYKSTSWDIVLAKYIGEDNRADLYVFDHGHNEVINHQWDNTEALGRIPENPGDRTYFIGAMEFLIDKIMEDHPEAKICLIGHYENDRKLSIVQSQVILAEHLGLPISKTWQASGWTREWMPDDLLPSSDKTGRSIEFLAELHSVYIEEQLIH